MWKIRVVFELFFFFCDIIHLMLMKVLIDKEEKEVIITRKKNNKNTYIRVKDDLNIYVTTNYFTSENQIKKLILENQTAVLKMLKQMSQKLKKENEFFYLGKKYNLVYLNTKDIILGEDYLLFNPSLDLDKWLLKQAKEIFKQELEKIYAVFPVTIPYPSLTIRKMKTRWGVCNVKTKRVTLNFELIKKDIKYLDYVIVHELSHLVYANHQADFWYLVSKLVPDYKKIRKELNSYE